jgi:hypothetical protein
MIRRTPYEKAEPDAHVAAYTVMFRRNMGYDPEDGNWFWIKYPPDGSLEQTPDGMAMAETWPNVPTSGDLPNCVAIFMGSVLSPPSARRFAACPLSPAMVIFFE